MGFSLGRALAGAIAGGAGAASEIADNQIKEAAQSRLMAQQEERQQRMNIARDEIAANRAQRVADTKERLDKNKRDKVSDFMKTNLAAMRAEKIDPGSVAGQKRLAVAAAEAGYQDYADKFFDNATRLGQIESSDGLRREEMKTRAEASRMARELNNDRKSAEKEDKEEMARQRQLDRISQVSITDRDGKKVSFDAAPYLSALYREGIDNGLRPRDALDAATAARKAIDFGLTKNSDFMTVVPAVVNAAATWRKAPETTVTKAPVSAPVIQAPAAPKPVTQGLFSRDVPAYAGGARDR